MFDADLADRVRDVLGPRPDLTEKRMFGGLAFLVRGNLCCGVRADSLLLRIGPEPATAALVRPGVRPFVSRGRPMTGWVLVATDAITTTDQLIEWLDQALTFTTALPAKDI